MTCPIHACSTHSMSLDEPFAGGPCVIRLKRVNVVIEPYEATIVADGKVICSYKVSSPFTEDQLSVLNSIDSSDPSVYIRELKRVTRSKCGICACTAHPIGADLKQPCTIPIRGQVFQGELVIHPTAVTFKSLEHTLYLYEVTYPFTREQLMTLNDVDSQEPDAYVRTLKFANTSFIPIKPERYTWNSPIPQKINEKIEPINLIL